MRTYRHDIAHGEAIATRRKLYGEILQVRRRYALGVADERAVVAVDLAKVAREEGIRITEAELPKAIGIPCLRAQWGIHGAGLQRSSAG